MRTLLLEKTVIPRGFDLRQLPNTILFNLFVHGVRGRIYITRPFDKPVFASGLSEKGRILQRFKNTFQMAMLELDFAGKSISESYLQQQVFRDIYFNYIVIYNSLQRSTWASIYGKKEWDLKQISLLDPFM
jgi:hypothetical protein